MNPLGKSEENHSAILHKMLPEVRHILQVAAVYHQPISKTDLEHLARDLRDCYARGELVFQSNFSSLCKNKVDELLKVKWLLQDPMKRVFVNPSILDIVLQSTILDGSFPALTKRIQQKYPRPPEISYELYGKEGLYVRDAHLAFYQGDWDVWNSMLSAQRFGSAIVKLPPAVLQPFRREIFERLTRQMQSIFLVKSIHELITLGQGSPEILDAFDQYVAGQSGISNELLLASVNLAIARGDMESLQRTAQLLRTVHPEMAGCEAFMLGQFDTALAQLDAGLKLLRKKTKKKKILLGNFPTFFQIVLLLKQHTAPALAKALELAMNPEDWKTINSLVFCGVGTLLQSSNSDLSTRTTLARLARDRYPLSLLVFATIWRFARNGDPIPLPASKFEEFGQIYRQLGLHWLADQMFSLRRIAEDYALTKERDTGSSRAGTFALPDLYELMAPEPVWKKSLIALANLVPDGTEGLTQDAAPSSSIRMIWEVSHSSGELSRSLDVSPFMQTLSARGWSKGRPVSLKRLYEGQHDAEFAFMSSHDQRICKCLTVKQSANEWGYRETVYDWDQARLADALVGHPLVFQPNERNTPTEVAQAQPQIVVNQPDQDSIVLRVYPECRGANFVLREDGPHRLVLTHFKPQQQQVATLLAGGLKIPVSEQQRVMQVVQRVSSLVQVHSDIAGDFAGQAIEGTPISHVHLIPFQSGLRADFYVRPFGEKGPFYRVGEGGEHVLAEVDGQRQTARRDLKLELQRKREVIAGCPLLVEWEATGESFTFPQPDDALELILDLQALAEQDQVALHWPQGKAFRVMGEVSNSQAKFHIKRDRDWFAASGSLHIDSETSLDLMRLLELLEHNTGRFVKLDDGRFFALTEQLRKRIEELAAFGERLKDKVRFAPIRAAALEDFANSTGAKVDKHWRENIERMRTACELIPKPSKDFQATLRDYQVEGYTWLRRLADWGVGACLADDMGLGKTVQAIALLIDRSDGPALVVAPTSVAFNWRNEIAKFAPTLNVKPFGTGDRAALLADLGPRDVVISSYGLLHSEAELFQHVAWKTVILDEAQAIKNMATKRSQAAMNLSAEFRLIMTGTPLENHLGELWNLFQFINPGLLGSLENFQRQFAIPIERDESKVSRARLKKLIQPFLLRRTKTQVLEELPSRTEVTLFVELSQEETAFYEALRLKAVEKLSQAQEQEQGSMHLRILAEMMRLRRACCHARLVMPESGIAGSKLAMFSETIDALLANNHKVLVFSQFVDHLSILREELDRKQVSYQYLDGSTPAKDRQKSVEAFQAGQGDVFLISLKAGGTGLNLTAADYVIHMDPWWNPAVEDQASDRAHRIGQLRPVTIYRLVTRGTIEEKIVELHQNKRGLADSLLEGADVTGKLSADELLKLLTE